MSGLATNSALTTVENSVGNLVKKTDYDTKVNETERKVLITSMTNILLLQNIIS